MLALTVHPGDYITIGDEVVVQVLRAGDTFRIAIDAPRSMAIERAKVHEQNSGVPDCIRKVRKSPPLKRAAGRPASRL